MNLDTLHAILLVAVFSELRSKRGQILGADESPPEAYAAYAEDGDEEATTQIALFHRPG
jgi:hypothetical protein